MADVFMPEECNCFLSEIRRPFQPRPLWAVTRLLRLLNR